MYIQKFEFEIVYFVNGRGEINNLMKGKGAGAAVFAIAKFEMRIDTPELLRHESFPSVGISEFVAVVVAVWVCECVSAASTLADWTMF